MDVTLTANDVELIVKAAEKTGYDSSFDDDYCSQNWHAHDDKAKSTVSFSMLSDETKSALRTGVSDIPDDAVVEFRWNEEWGNWADVFVSGKPILNFYANGLPWEWLSEDFHD